MKVLVTGCGGDIGQSIGKILLKEKRITKLYGCDITDKNAGKFIFRNFFIGLRVSDNNYLKSLEEIVEEKDIDIIIPISEPELRFFSEIDVQKIGKAKIICANPKAMKIGFDKLLTTEFLEEKNILFPKTELISKSKSVIFPVIAKARTGSGSQNVFLLKDNVDFEYIKAKYPDFILQEYLSSDLGEFTCGLFKSEKHGFRSIILKRELTGGYSGYGEVIHNEEISLLLKALANSIDLNGSINVQLRLTKEGPFVFEINPRFSSTVLFRHMFGFTDLLWSLEDVLGLPLTEYEEVAAGRKFYKGFSEYVD